VRSHDRFKQVSEVRRGYFRDILMLILGGVKIVQQAVVTILNQIYEEDFLGFSYGFRPGRSQHDALDALSYALLKKKVNYIVDADIRGFLDSYSQCSYG